MIIHQCVTLDLCLAFFEFFFCCRCDDKNGAYRIVLIIAHARIPEKNGLIIAPKIKRWVSVGV